MALDFPSAPTVGQTYNGYIYDGTKWKASPTSVAPSVVSATPPTNPTVGDMWFNSTDGTMYFYYNDGSTSQWVESRAPITANGYYSPNYIINGAFDFWQRGTSSTTPADSAYTAADRWSIFRNGSGIAFTVSQQAFTPGSLPVTGVEGTYFYRVQQTTAGTGQTYMLLSQKVEDVRTLAGQTATLSFWAKSDTARTIPYTELRQVFGSGGSGDVSNNLGSYNVTTSWQKITMTVTLASIAGKTIGANNFLQLFIALPFNTTYTLDIFGVQLEAGSAATTFRRNANSIQGELAACQRYYWRSTNNNIYSVHGSGNANSTGTAVSVRVQMPVVMRVAPISIEYSSLFLWDNVNTPGLTSLALAGSFSNSSSAQLDAASNALTAGRTYSLLNQANAAGYLGISAEL